MKKCSTPKTPKSVRQEEPSSQDRESTRERPARLMKRNTGWIFNIAQIMCNTSEITAKQSCPFRAFLAKFSSNHSSELICQETFISLILFQPGPTLASLLHP